MTDRPLTTRLQFWLDHYHACITAEQGFAAYCKEHNLRSRPFEQARHELRQRGLIPAKKRTQNNQSNNSRAGNHPNAFSKVIVSPDRSTVDLISADMARILLPGGLSITLPAYRLRSMLPSLLGGDYDSPQ